MLLIQNTIPSDGWGWDCGLRFSIGISLRGGKNWDVIEKSFGSIDVK